MYTLSYIPSRSRQTFMLPSGLEKYLNSILPVGQVTLKFCLPGALPHLPDFSNSLIIHEFKMASNYRRVVSAHPYCTRKSTCHVMQRARALSTKMNNDRAEGHCYIDLIGFNFLGRSVTPTFLSRYRLYLQLFPHCPKMNKKSM